MAFFQNIDHLQRTRHQSRRTTMKRIIEWSLTARVPTFLAHVQHLSSARCVRNRLNESRIRRGALWTQRWGLEVRQAGEQARRSAAMDSCNFLKNVNRLGLRCWTTLVSNENARSHLRSRRRGKGARPRRDQLASVLYSYVWSRPAHVYMYSESFSGSYSR